MASPDSRLPRTAIPKEQWNRRHRESDGYDVNSFFYNFFLPVITASNRKGRGAAIRGATFMALASMTDESRTVREQGY
jgi:hypothetical protein